MQGLLILLSVSGVLLALSLAVTRTPQLGLLLWVGVSAPLEMYRMTFGPVNLSLFRLAVLGAALWIAWTYVRQRTRPRAAPPQSLDAWLVTAFLGFAGAVALSLALGRGETGYAVRFLGIAAAAAVALLVLMFLAKRVSTRDAAIVLLASAVLPVLAASWQGLAARVGAQPSLPLLSTLPLTSELSKSRDAVAQLGDLGERLHGTFADPNHFGAYLAFVLCVAAGLALHALMRGHNRESVLFAIFAVAITAALIGTYSRTGWLAAVTGLVVLTAVSARLVGQRLGGRGAAIAATAAVVGVAIVVVPVAPQTADRLDSGAATNQTSDASHLESMGVAAELFLDEPVLGSGVGAIGRDLQQGPRASGAHSSYLTAAAELGLLGLAVMAAAIAIVLLNFRRRLARSATRHLSLALFAAYVGFLLANAVYDLWWDDVHWLILAVLFAGALASDAAAIGPAVRRTSVTT